MLWQAAEAVAADAVCRHRDANPSRQHFAPNDLQVLWRDCGLSGVETQAQELSIELGLIGCAVGAPFAVLIAEQLFACGCRLLISMTSAGQLIPLIRLT